MKINRMELRPLTVASLLVLMVLTTALTACLGNDRETDTSQTSTELREIIREVLTEQREAAQTATPLTPETGVAPFPIPAVDTRPTRPPEQNFLIDPPFAHEPSPSPTPEPAPVLTILDGSVTMPDPTPMASLTPTPFPMPTSDQPEPFPQTDATARMIGRSVSDIVVDSPREPMWATVTYEFTGFSVQSYRLAIVSGQIIDHCESIDDGMLILRGLLWTKQYELQVFTEPNCGGIPVQSPQFLFVPQDIESTG